MTEKRVRTDESKPRRGIGPVGTALIIALAAALLAGACWLAYEFTTGKVVTFSVRSMEEVSFHDEAAIARSLDNRWDNLASIGEECRQGKFTSLNEVLDFLRIKEKSYGYADLGLVSTDGNIYFGSLIVSQDQSILALCHENEEHFAVRFDMMEVTKRIESRSDCLLLGQRVREFEVEDETFAWVVARISLDSLGEEFRLDSYDGQGTSCLITSEGDYIVSEDVNNYVGHSPNLFTELQEDAEILGGESLEGIEQKVAERRSFSVTIEENGQTYVLQFTPMAEPDWYFVMKVPRSIFEQQSFEITSLMLGVLLAMFACLAVVLVLLVRNRMVTESAQVDRKHKEELSLALEEADRASRAKTVFLSNMSHEFRTPMNSIVGFAALAQTKVDDPERVQDYLAKISQSSSHLLSLINDVLDMSRIESGKVVLEEAPENLEDIMAGVRNIVQTDAFAHGLRFSMDLSGVRDEDVWCDRLRLNQILLNLLSNAVKFTPAGGSVCVTVSQLPHAPEGFGTYLFRVADTGIGMAPEFIDTVFESFSRERTSTVSRIEGTGLGMSITKGIVELMGGEISVQSALNEGTEFAITLTLRLVEGAQPPQAIEALQGRVVLVGEDDPVARESALWLLRRAGARAEVLETPEALIARAQGALPGEQPAAVLVAWGFLGPNAKALLTALRQALPSDIPVVACTSYAVEEVESEAVEAGVTQVVPKPLLLGDLRLVMGAGRKKDAKTALAAAIEQSSFEGLRILLFEDNFLARELASEILRGVGFEVETAENGQIGVDMLKEAPAGYYDLIVSDVQMPVMDGHAAARAIRALDDPEKASIPIIALTANAFDEDKQAARDAGMDAHMAKPVDVEVLTTTLQQILESRS